MPAIPDSFEFEYGGSEIWYHRRAVDRLGRFLRERELDRALVVTGMNVGSNPAVMDPVECGLGERLEAVFDRTTPEKLAGTVFDGVDRMRAVEADVLVGLGGGSSLDIARQMSLVAADGRTLSDLRTEAFEGEVMPLAPAASPTPVVVVPTTFAGADISSGGTFEVLAPDESPGGQPVRFGGSMAPLGVCYDPDLFETTSHRILAGSAMNGFNKGLETLYAPVATPITDATAVRGLRLLRSGLPRLTVEAAASEASIVGLILVQFERQVSLIHAIGHGFTRHSDLQQGVAHAIVTPHALRYLFEAVDARRGVVAEAMEVDATGRSPDKVAAAIVEEVERVRDALSVPTRIREVDGVREDDLRTMAEYIATDAFLRDLPAGLDPSVDDLEDILRAAW